MKRFLVLGLLAGLVLFASESNAGVLKFAGTTSSAQSAADGLAWSMDVVFTPASGAIANISSAVLTIGTETFLLNTNVLSNPDTVTVTSVGGPNNDTATLAMHFLGSSPSSVGSTVAILTSLVVNGKVDVPAVASDANIAALAALGNLVTGGSLVVAPGFGGTGSNLITLNGSIPVPEPSSVILLTGLGLVVGRRFLRRVSKK